MVQLSHVILFVGAAVLSVQAAPVASVEERQMQGWGAASGYVCVNGDCKTASVGPQKIEAREVQTWGAGYVCVNGDCKTGTVGPTIQRRQGGLGEVLGTLLGKLFS
ncbi:hypothetical protein DL96DRAFT_1604195 [Flagelloscypha sp. PMI_526]|nr:hypothetical protein DL96DRAFT_1604195 [Flagelloscypha sp. PMI_526]